jgi:hypothetical protein
VCQISLTDLGAKWEGGPQVSSSQGISKVLGVGSLHYELGAPKGSLTS